MTVLDTHDGIGVIDVGADREIRDDTAGPADAEEIDRSGRDDSRAQRRREPQATGSAANNLDLYQVNCTFYDALGGATTST